VGTGRASRCRLGSSVSGERGWVGEEQGECGYWVRPAVRSSNCSFPAVRSSSCSRPAVRSFKCSLVQVFARAGVRSSRCLPIRYAHFRSRKLHVPHPGLPPAVRDDLGAAIEARGKRLAHLQEFQRHANPVELNEERYGYNIAGESQCCVNKGGRRDEQR